MCIKNPFRALLQKLLQIPLSAAAKHKAKQHKKESASQPPPKKSPQKPIEQRKPLLTDTLLKRYKINKIIGMGRFGLVYQAADTENNTAVVIKEYYPKHCAKRATDKITLLVFTGRKRINYNAGFKQFFSEALVLHKTNHPNILKARNIFRANNTAYMVFNSETGRDLKWFLGTTKQPLHNGLILKIFLPILSGLNALHRADCLHLDLKPANILLRVGGAPLLLDFGAAQDMTRAKRLARRTLTHGFAPPEQYSKKGNLGPWTDLYALAATLFYAITQRPPIKSKNATAENQISVVKYAAHYSTQMLDAINQTLAHDCSKRRQTADEFAQALLAESKWATLTDYERQAMGYDRHADCGKTALI